MALDKQIHVYSVDTSAFYNQYEQRIAKLMSKYYHRRYNLINKKTNTDNEKKEIYECNKKIKKYKKLLKKIIKKNYKFGLALNDDSIRRFNLKHKRDSNIVSVFDSFLTRTIGAEIGKITDDIIIVQTYFYEIFEDIVNNGFYMNNEKYKIFTASAGQIRTKKTVFIKESVWNKYKNTLTCGLSIDKINKLGGTNVNKYLAYLALTNSATDLWDDFNIDKCIVVDDFETNIITNVDYIDEKTYNIEQNKRMEVPIPHMDGCGIYIGHSAFMIRIPWIKGLLVPYDYVMFINENIKKFPKCNIIKDIYGKKWDIIKDDIQVIFTKSQFKMWKFYNSWEDYKNNFKKYKCTAGKCNEEPEYRKDAKVNYQMMQTLVDISESELKKLAKPLNDKIDKITHNKDSMLKVLGVDKYNKNKNNLQKALELYPQLLKDEHCKNLLRQLRNKLIKEGKSGKLPMSAKYTFLIPDLYAFSEWLFLKKENPKGLLENGEVSCRLFNNNKKLDVLRSPHLYFEHCIRKNKVNTLLNKWFICDGIYTSCHDAISKVLMFDNDGDQALVNENNTWVSISERNFNAIQPKPLYYEMKKANGHNLSNKTFYEGMMNAYSGGNIGIYSNDISKVLNSDNVNWDVIKYLCMENNFVIDYAKTLYKPKRPSTINNLIKKYTKNKTPYFFKYAKDKNDNQVEKINQSTVNKLNNIIKNKRISFNSKGFGRFNYKDLMSDKDVLINDEIIDTYKKVCRSRGRIMQNSTYNSDISYNYLYQVIREKILEVNNDEVYVTDVLVKYLFSKKTKDKTILWNSFGDIIVKNIENNIANLMEKGYKGCTICGKLYKSKSNRTKYCEKCAREIQLEHARNYKDKIRC